MLCMQTHFQTINKLSLNDNDSFFSGSQIFLCTCVLDCTGKKVKKPKQKHHRIFRNWSVLLLLWLFMIYLHTKTGFTAISMHVLVQLILCVWRNDWLTSEWMRVTFFYYYVSAAVAASSEWHFAQNILRKIPALYRYNFIVFFVNVNNNTLQLRVRSLTLAHATQTVDTPNKTVSVRVRFGLEME